METSTAGVVPAMREVSVARWNALARKRIFFGHQSVGGNIIAGVHAVLADHPQVSLRVTEVGATAGSDVPGLQHARVGRNGDIVSKLEAFATAVGALAPSVAMLKFCYVDVDGSVAPASVFAEYERRMRSLRAEHPSLVVVHMTMPLTGLDGRKARLREWLGGPPTQQTLNAARNEFNDHMLGAYAGREPVFDLARIESTLPDGSRTSFRRSGRDVHFLARGLTDDGGHLNDRGSRIVAEALLVQLANL